MQSASKLAIYELGAESGKTLLSSFPPTLPYF